MDNNINSGANERIAYIANKISDTDIIFISQ